MLLPLSDLSMTLLPKWFTGILEGFAPLFSARIWPRVQLLVVGAVLSPGKRTVTAALRVLGLADDPAFGTFHRDAEYHGIRDIVVICHGVTLRAFVMMWCHLSPEWFEAERNPGNCAVRFIESGVDQGYLFDGFPKR